MPMADDCEVVFTMSIPVRGWGEGMTEQEQANILMGIDKQIATFVQGRLRRLGYEATIKTSVQPPQDVFRMIWAMVFVGDVRRAEDSRG